MVGTRVRLLSLFAIAALAFGACSGTAGSAAPNGSAGANGSAAANSSGGANGSAASAACAGTGTQGGANLQIRRAQERQRETYVLREQKRERLLLHWSGWGCIDQSITTSTVACDDSLSVSYSVRPV